MAETIMPGPWSEPVDKVLKNFHSSGKTGLTGEQVTEAHRLFGKNVLREEKKITNFTILLKQFQNPMVYTLFLGTLIAFFIGEYIDAICILAILLVNGMIGFFQEAKSNAAVVALKKLSVPHVRVKREGKTEVVASEDVVPGDILQLEAGDYVTADARIIEAFQLSADEASLTGESWPVEKNSEKLDVDTPLADRHNMLHAGSAISNGTGRAVVTATGMDSEIGHIAELLEETEIIETPLQGRLNVVSNRLILMTIVVMIIVMIIRFYEGHPWFVIFMSAISLAIAAIPEGLPTVVTLALTLAVRRMTKRHALVRKLSAVETLGSTDVICTDKTGTLTTGEMTVREVFLLEEVLREEFIQALILCNNATIEGGGSGDPTERALLTFAQLENFSVPQIRENFPRVHEWTFESDRKRMSVAVTSPLGTRILTKGAPEVMIERCILDEKQRRELFDKIQYLTSRGHRLLAIAHKMGDIIYDPHLLEKDLNFLGLIAMSDPPKSETMDAIKECQNAGIKVVMVTGDHPATAMAIALELGIAVPGLFDEIMTGREIENLGPEELRARSEKTAVYARVSPEHKLKIVEALQKNGHVVAMTGDGVNDAPALRKAQIGVAMGRAGTEVARQALSMILTDDNFSTIVSAVEEGRAIYGNIRRTIQYFLSTNLSEILIVLGSSILNLPIPFTPIGLLWINLVTDGFPALALASEPLAKNTLIESDRPSQTTFFDRKFVIELFSVGGLMTLIILGVYFYMLQEGDEVVARTYAFNLLVYMKLLRSFSSRSDKRTYFQLKLNFYHLGSVMAPILIQFWFQHYPFFDGLLGITLLDFHHHVYMLLISLVPVTLLELAKIRRQT